MFDHQGRRGAIDTVAAAGTTLCWAAKGGSGTTVVVAALALANPAPVLIIDLAGDLPAALGIPEPVGPGVFDWLLSDAPGSHLEQLAVDVRDGIRLLPAGRPSEQVPLERWDALLTALTDHGLQVVIDAGSGSPPRMLTELVDETLIVTRACYLALRRAIATSIVSTGAILVAEPGRALRAADVEAALGVPIVATVTVDPVVARAVDAGLLAARLPRGLRRELTGAT
jgi:MinD-like ATPase involved in chromosome partitioning or flagellar assembly